MEKKRIHVIQEEMKFIEENDQWVHLSCEAKKEITGLVSQLLIDWIKQMDGTEKGTGNE